VTALVPAGEPFQDRAISGLKLHLLRGWCEPFEALEAKTQLERDIDRAAEVVVMAMDDQTVPLHLSVIGELDAARRKGAIAASEGKSIEANPYSDARTYRGSVTFSRAFWRAWREGWKDNHDRPAAHSVLHPRLSPDSTQ
jgi:hypothetical protein